AQVRHIVVAQRDAVRGARVDEIARLKHHELAEIPDDVVHAEDHVSRGAVLANRPVDTKSQRQPLNVGDFVRGGQPRSKWNEGLTALTLVPLPTALELEFTLGHVMGDAVASDNRRRLIERTEVSRVCRRSRGAQSPNRSWLSRGAPESCHR